MLGGEIIGKLKGRRGGGGAANEATEFWKLFIHNSTEVQDFVHANAYQGRRRFRTFSLVRRLGHLVRVFRKANSSTLLLTEKKQRGIKNKISALCL